jgi:hypothetical protein
MTTLFASEDAGGRRSCRHLCNGGICAVIGAGLLHLLCIGKRAGLNEKLAERTMANKKKMTMGVIVGNRGFFPDHLKRPAAKR